MPAVIESPSGLMMAEVTSLAAMLTFHLLIWWSTYFRSYLGDEGVGKLEDLEQLDADAEGEVHLRGAEERRGLPY